MNLRLSYTALVQKNCLLFKMLLYNFVISFLCIRWFIVFLYSFNLIYLFPLLEFQFFCTLILWCVLIKIVFYSWIFFIRFSQIWLLTGDFSQFMFIVSADIFGSIYISYYKLSIWKNFPLLISPSSFCLHFELLEGFAFGPFCFRYLQGRWTFMFYKSN